MLKNSMLACIVMLLSCPIPGWGQNKKAEDVRVQILVPVHDLRPYTLLTDKMFTIVEIAPSKLREDIADTITRLDQVQGKTSRHYKLRANEPVYKNDLVDEIEDDSKHHHRLDNGNVAHAIKLPPGRIVVGQIKPGDKLNLKCSYTEKDKVISEPLDKVEVLSVKSVETKEQTTITVQLIVKPSQALLLKYCADAGSIKVVHWHSTAWEKANAKMRFHVRDNVSDYDDDIPTTDKVFPPFLPQQVTARYLGHWQWSTKQRLFWYDSLDVTYTADVIAKRAINDQYVEIVTTHPNNTSSVMLVTYDEEKKLFRAWQFTSERKTTEYAGKWNEALQTMTWKTLPGADQHILTQRFTNSNTIEWRACYYNEKDVLLRMHEGKTTRMEQKK